MKQNFLDINGKKHPIEIQFLKKKHSSGTVKNGRVILRLSQNLSQEKVYEHIEYLLLKIKKRMHRNNHAKENICAFKNVFNEENFSKNHKSLIGLGNITLQNGVNYFARLVVKSSRKNITVDIVENNIIIKVPNIQWKDYLHDIEDVLYRVIAKDQQEYVTCLVEKINNLHFQEKYRNIKVKHTHSRWGSCNSRGDICISVRLLFLPFELLEYVIIHELAHLREMNHSQKFWKHVEVALPDYKEKRKKLKSFV